MSDNAGNEPPWLDRVRHGDFSAMPEAFTWEDSAAFAHLLHYDVSVALGLGELALWANERADEAAMTGSWRATAIELWLCTFYEHRRYRHFGFEPAGADHELIAHLWQQLRSQLQTIGDDERTTILAQIAASATKMR
ncbi:hypothetical protein ABE438_16135 [Bosea sp. TWI1241]|uniref:hypothetical protein n=1 Tax=Bosea sp. TWI1241 TaxID=3148904 RepID=UPI00320A2B54